MIHIRNLTTSEIDEKWMERIAHIALAHLKRSERDLNIILTGERRMRALNRFYRGKNKVTDVLAFPYSQNRLVEVQREEALQTNHLLGEVVICMPQAKKQARRAAHPLARELATLLLHGMLHLAGYDHEKNEQEAQRMFALQDELLAKVL